MKIDADELQTKATDDKRHIFLGMKYANRHVMVAVVDVETEHPAEDTLSVAYHDVSEGLPTSLGSRTRYPMKRGTGSMTEQKISYPVQ